MAKPARNEPCPCGSGRKYKRCCLGTDRDSGASATRPTSPAEEIAQAVQGRDFASMEELQAFLGARAEALNRRPLEAFCGLSPEQMHGLLHRPLDSPQLLALADELPEPQEAPVARLFGLLADALGERGVKPTAKGYLPRALCREVAQAYLGESGYAEMTRFGALNRELEFDDLHTTRLVGQLGGLLRRYRGRFILSRDARHRLARKGLGLVYPRLLTTYVQAFNWAYRDGFPDAPIVQRSWAFTLRLLQRFGDTERPAAFYADAFIEAFPEAVDEMGDTPFWTPEKELRLTYELRALERFAAFFGLIEVRDVPGDEDAFGPPCGLVRKTPLLDRLVTFHV